MTYLVIEGDQAWRVSILKSRLSLRGWML